MRRMRRHLVLHLAAGVVACGESDVGVQQPMGPTLPDSVFEPVATISLEEGDDVINVTPEVVVQDDGSFLIVDGREKPACESMTPRADSRRSSAARERAQESSACR